MIHLFGYPECSIRSLFFFSCSAGSRVKFPPSESIIIWCLPVNAEGTQAQHRDPHRGLLHEGHQLAQRHSEGPVLREQLGRERDTNFFFLASFSHFRRDTFTFAALSLQESTLITACEPKFKLSCSAFSPFYVFLLTCSWRNLEPGRHGGSEKQHDPAQPWTERPV